MKVEAQAQDRWVGGARGPGSEQGVWYRPRMERQVSRQLLRPVTLSTPRVLRRGPAAPETTWQHRISHDISANLSTTGIQALPPRSH